MDPAETARLEDFNEPQYPRNFQLRKGKHVLPIVYKMHGSLAPDLKDTEDGLVITDGDYVDFISASSDIVPSSIVFLMAGRRVLFLGYSFSDWNVRSIYETVMHKDGQEQQDYAVTMGLSKFEETYFRKRNIIVVLEGLREFVQGVSGLQAGKWQMIERPPNPFKGVESYTEPEYGKLFGRDADFVLMKARIFGGRTTLLFAGTGVARPPSSKRKSFPN